MPKPLRVTDHALVRFFERVMGWDVDGARQEILSRIERKDGVHRLQGTKLQAVVHNGHVITLRPTEPMKHPHMKTIIRERKNNE